MIRTIFCLLCSVVLSTSIAHADVECFLDKPSEGFATCEYSKYTTILSCKYKASIVSIVEVGVDQGSANTKSRSYFVEPDPSLQDCQQTAARTYASTKKGYDVGHLTPIDLLDEDTATANETNSMTNLVPQESTLKRSGLWRKSERIVDCHRDDTEITPLRVFSGVIFGNDSSNDHYSISHGLPSTPDYLWKVVYSEKANKYDAWIFNNMSNANSKKLADHRRTLESLKLTLEQQGEKDYLPVISSLNELIKEKPEQMQLEILPQCHMRRG